MKEIITIQCGSSANYVGAHFWNLLDAAYALRDTTDDASVMFRSSSSGASTAWHPRVVAVDSKGGFGALTAQGFVTSDSERGAAAASLWGGGIEVIEQDAIGMHAFTRHLLARDGGDDDGDAACESQGDEDDDSDSDSSQRKSAQKKFSALQQQMLHAGGSDAGASQSEPPLDAVNMDELSAGLLDDSVRYWSDFQQSVFHERSYCPLHIDHGHNGCSYFGGPGIISSNREQLERIEDSIRWYAEECDGLQGFHFMMDLQTAFGGIACSLLESIDHEYPRRPVLAASMSLHSPPPPSERSQLEAEEHGLEEEEKEECDHLSAALVTAHIASLRMLHVPFSDRCFLPASRPAAFEWNMEPTSLFRNSAVIASAFDVLTSPQRGAATQTFPSPLLAQIVADLQMPYSQPVAFADVQYTSIDAPLHSRIGPLSQRVFDPIDLSPAAYRLPRGFDSDWEGGEQMSAMVSMRGLFPRDLMPVGGVAVTRDTVNHWLLDSMCCDGYHVPRSYNCLQPLCVPAAFPRRLLPASAPGETFGCIARASCGSASTSWIRSYGWLLSGRVMSAVDNARLRQSGMMKDDVQELGENLLAASDRCYD